MGLFRKKQPKDVAHVFSLDDLAVDPPRDKPGVDDRTKEIIARYRESWILAGLNQSSKRYFELMATIQDRDKSDSDVFGACQFSWALLEPFILSQRVEKYGFDHIEDHFEVMDQVELIDYAYRRLCGSYGRLLWGDDEIPEFGDFLIQTIPCIEWALRYTSVLGLVGQLKNLAGIVAYFPPLTRLYGAAVADAEHQMALAKRIRAFVKEHPGAIQSELKTGLECDGRLASNLCRWMTDWGLLKREKEGKSYRLFLAYGDDEQPKGQR
jgi:hypothetical protein